MIIDNNEIAYTYDNRYQLTSVEYPDDWHWNLGLFDTNYYYDNIANRTGTAYYYYSWENYPYSHNRLNQYTATENWQGLDYDDNGNMTSTGGPIVYFYDSQNQLIEVYHTGWSQTLTTYTYDYANRRATSTDLDWDGIYYTTIKYVYDGDKIIAEYDGEGTLLRKYVYGPGIDEPVCMINVSGQAETKYYYHFDGLGSVMALTDSDGAVIERYVYDVFGGTYMLDGGGDYLWESAHGNRFTFTGREYERNTGNYYYRARYYDPSIGRFLQPDPIGYYDSMNLYQYCFNNPINFRDPYGLDAWYNPSWIGFVISGGFSGHWGEAGAAAGQGAAAGAIITADAYTFGLIDPLNGLASEKVCEYGDAGKWSRRFADISATAAYSAAGTAIFEKATSATKMATRVAKGADGATSQILKTTSKVTGNTLKVEHRVIRGRQIIHQHTKYRSFWPW